MKEMLRHNKSVVRIVLSFVLAFVLLALIGAGVALAAYTHSLHAQRVFAPYEVGVRFSSNYLLKGDSDKNIKIIYTTDASATGVNPAAILTVCNYAQGRQTEPNSSNITYTLSARLVKTDVSGAYVEASTSDVAKSSYNITLKVGNDELVLGQSRASGSFTKTIAGGTATANVYELIFDKSMAADRPNMYLEVVVTPDGGLPSLSGIFKADLRVEGENNSWSASFTDDTTNLLPADYDGYNYLVSGFGSGQVTITWDASRVEMNYVSLKELLAIDNVIYNESGNNRTIIFNVNSSVINRYEIQFYKKNIDNTVSWNYLENTIVTFNFE